MEANTIVTISRNRSISWMSLVAAICILQLTFAATSYIYFLELNQQKANVHANVVASALWQYDASTISPYLHLAMDSDQYRFVQVVDRTGKSFVDLSISPESNIARWLVSPLSKLDTSYNVPIIYGNREIGTLSVGATAIPMFSANILFFICIIGIALVIRIFLSERWYRVTLEQYSDQLRSANTKLAKAVTSAEKANESKTVFLANMSHEIRTPMNGVLGVAELLEKTVLDAEQTKYVHTIKHSGGVLLSIISDILDLSKIESGRLDILLDSVDIHELIKHIALPFQLNCQKGVNFQIIVDPNVPRFIETDAVRLQQILNNLLNNAFKFTESGHITLILEHIISHEGDAIKLEVRDSGIGIEQTVQKRLFRPFAQAEASTSSQFGGTGLGLAICSRLAELLNGSIQLESELGCGSTFSVVLPLIVSKQPHKNRKSVITQTDSHPAIGDLLSGKQILVVEDNPVNIMVTVGFLNHLGLTAITAENGEAALDLIYKGESFDLIFMDCDMPVMDGFKATEDIRHWESAQNQKRTRICALTAHVLPEYKRKCTESGMDDCLTKPITFSGIAGYLEQTAAKIVQDTE